MARVTKDGGGKFKEIMIERALEDKTKLQQAKENCEKTKQMKFLSAHSEEMILYVR